jgi:hypothetical protein
LIFDRRPFYLFGGLAALVLIAIAYFAAPKVTPEQRVQEQLAILAREPWTKVRVQDVQFVGTGTPEQVLVRGVRLDSGAPVVIDFAAKGPYTSAATLQRLSDPALVGQVAEVQMLPRSLAHEPYRSTYQPNASHVGVALFAGFPGGAAAGSTGTADAAPAAVPATTPATSG